MSGKEMRFQVPQRSNSTAGSRN